jgi:hypothetical protein
MDEMEVDDEYQIGEGDVLDHSPIFEHWNENNSDCVFINDKQIAGPSTSFHTHSHSFKL